jgi:dihydroorotase
MLLIKGGRVIDPTSQRNEIADILIEDGAIKEICRSGCYPPAEIIDASGLIVAPALVDAHAHFRDPGFTYKEDIESGARAATRGGYASVVLMANTKPCVDNVETLRYVLDKGLQTGIRVASCANATIGMKGQEIVAMASLAAAGAVAFSDDGLPIKDENVARAAMQKAAEVGLPLSLHEEEEVSLVRRDLALLAETEARVVFQHISTKAAVELIREAKLNNSRYCKGHIFAEATPHHFSLTEEAVATKGTLAKMNPPLRTEADRQAVIRGLQDGTLDIIATDHAPHSQSEKEQPYDVAPNGIIGLETALSLGIRELVMPGYISLVELIKLMSTVPASIFGLTGGEIAVGKDADLVIFDSEATWTVGSFYSKAENSPFIGETLPGVVRYTICRGEVVYRHCSSQ